MDFSKPETGYVSGIDKGCDLFISRKEISASIFGPGIRNATRFYSLNFRSIISLRDLLLKQGVNHIVMHKSSFYWKLAYDILCDHFTITVINQRDLQDACC